jgi:hypothetical protein
MSMAWKLQFRQDGKLIMPSLSTPGGEEGIDLADGTIAYLQQQLGINSPAELNGKPVSEVADQWEQAAKAIDGQFSELATIAKQNPQAVLQVEEVPLDEMPA